MSCSDRITDIQNIDQIPVKYNCMHALFHTHSYGQYLTELLMGGKSCWHCNIGWHCLCKYFHHTGGDLHKESQLFIRQWTHESRLKRELSMYSIQFPVVGAIVLLGQENVIIIKLQLFPSKMHV